MKEKIKIEIAEFCEDCIFHENCPEEECVLFRIEQLLNRKVKDER
jgi:hypothetical protein